MWIDQSKKVEPGSSVSVSVESDLIYVLNVLGPYKPAASLHEASAEADKTDQILKKRELWVLVDAAVF